jgi:hypothetical protein
LNEGRTGRLARGGPRERARSLAHLRQPRAGFRAPTGEGQDAAGPGRAPPRVRPDGRRTRRRRRNGPSPRKPRAGPQPEPSAGRARTAGVLAAGRSRCARASGNAGRMRAAFVPVRPWSSQGRKPGEEWRCDDRRPACGRVPGCRPLPGASGGAARAPASAFSHRRPAVTRPSLPLRRRWRARLRPLLRRDPRGRIVVTTGSGDGGPYRASRSRGRAGKGHIVRSVGDASSERGLPLLPSSASGSASTASHGLGAPGFGAPADKHHRDKVHWRIMRVAAFGSRLDGGLAIGMGVVGAGKRGVERRAERREILSMGSPRCEQHHDGKRQSGISLVEM